jgi:hypothetical protein
MHLHFKVVIASDPLGQSIARHGNGLMFEFRREGRRVIEQK